MDWWKAGLLPSVVPGEEVLEFLSVSDEDDSLNGSSARKRTFAETNVHPTKETDEHEQDDSDLSDDEVAEPAPFDFSLTWHGWLEYGKKNDVQALTQKALRSFGTAPVWDADSKDWDATMRFQLNTQAGLRPQIAAQFDGDVLCVRPIIPRVLGEEVGKVVRACKAFVMQWLGCRHKKSVGTWVPVATIFVSDVATLVACVKASVEDLGVECSTSVAGSLPVLYGSNGEFSPCKRKRLANALRKHDIKFCFVHAAVRVAAVRRVLHMAVVSKQG